MFAYGFAGCVGWDDSAIDIWIAWANASSSVWAIKTEIHLWIKLADTCTIYMSRTIQILKENVDFHDPETRSNDFYYLV